LLSFEVTYPFFGVVFGLRLSLFHFSTAAAAAAASTVAAKAKNMVFV